MILGFRCVFSLGEFIKYEVADVVGEDKIEEAEVNEEEDTVPIFDVVISSVRIAFKLSEIYLVCCRVFLAVMLLVEEDIVSE